MVRRFLSLLLAVALLGLTAQSAAYAASRPRPMPIAMSMDTNDCMKMMQQAAPDKASKGSTHKSCTPADCLNFMMACSGIALTLPDDPTAMLVAFDQRSLPQPPLVRAMRGRSPPPDIQPPIA